MTTTSTTAVWRTVATPWNRAFAALTEEPGQPRTTLPDLSRQAMAVFMPLEDYATAAKILLDSAKAPNMAETWPCLSGVVPAASDQLALRRDTYRVWDGTPAMMVYSIPLPFSVNTDAIRAAIVAIYLQLCMDCRTLPPFFSGCAFMTQTPGSIAHCGVRPVWIFRALAIASLTARPAEGVDPNSLDAQTAWIGAYQPQLSQDSTALAVNSQKLSSLSVMFDVANLPKVDALLSDAMKLQKMEVTPLSLSQFRRTFVEALRKVTAQGVIMMWCYKQIPIKDYVAEEQKGYTREQRFQTLDSLFFMSVAALMSAYQSAGIAVTGMSPANVGMRYLVADEPVARGNHCVAIRLWETTDVIIRHYNVVPSILIGGGSAGYAQPMAEWRPAYLVRALVDLVRAFRAAVPPGDGVSNGIPVFDSGEGLFHSTLGNVMRFADLVKTPDAAPPENPASVINDLNTFLVMYAERSGCQVKAQGFGDLSASGITDWRAGVL